MTSAAWLESAWPAADNGDDAGRMSHGEKLCKPRPVRVRGRWQRAPGGEWDWFYALEPSEQRWLQANHMADIGAGPDEIARWNGYGTDVDAAMSAWLTAARLDRKRSVARGVAARVRQLDPLSDAYAAQWEEYDSAQVPDLDILGPQELAAELGVSAPVVHQWRKRGRLPAPDLIVSKVPMWHRGTLRKAGTLPDE